MHEALVKRWNRMHLMVVRGAMMLCAGGSLLAQSPRVIRESAAQWQAAPMLTLTAERRWCEHGDSPGCDFKRLVSAQQLPDGGILAADAAGPLNRFGADGQFMASLGRKGQGPGEYGFVIDPTFASNGLVTWFDNTQMRIATVKLDGTPGPVTRLMPPHTMVSVMMVDSQLVVLDVPAVPVVGDSVTATYHTVPAAGTPRVLARVRMASVFAVGSDTRPMAGPFEPRTLGHVGAAGDVAHSNGMSYDVEVFPSAGKPWRLQINAPRRAVTSTERDSAMAAALKMFRVTSPNALPKTVRAAYEASAQYHPPLTTLRALRDGTLWIRPTPGAGATKVPWDVFSRDGARLGRAMLPSSGTVLDGTRDWVLVRELGEDDVPTVVRYKVTRR